MTARPPPVYGFCVGVEGWPERFEINASSVSAARSQIWREAKEIGAPAANLRRAQPLRGYRAEELAGFDRREGQIRAPPFVAGALVTVLGVTNPHTGRIVDATSGACFVVLCEGERLTAHPADLAVVDEPKWR